MIPTVNIREKKDVLVDWTSGGFQLRSSSVLVRFH